MSRAGWAVPQVTIPLRVAHAIAQIREDYSDNVDVLSKSKSLLKFGRNPTVGTSYETVWSIGGDETYVTTNAIDRISSSSTGDTTQTITIEGHTVSGTGTDAQFTFVNQTASLNGQNKVTLSTPLARVSRAYSDAALAGDVQVYEDTALTAGLPTDQTKAHIQIKGTSGYVQSDKAATTFSNTDYFILTQVYCGAAKQGTSTALEMELQIREVGNIFRPRFDASFSSSSGGAYIDLDPAIIVPKNADVRLVVEATNSTEVTGWFNGYIAQVSRSG